MRKILGLFFLLALAGSAHSQVLISLLLGDKLNSEGLEFGLTGGFNWSTISNMEADKSLSTLNLGFYFDIRMKQQFWLHTGVLVKSRLGVAELSTNDLNYLEVSQYESGGDYNQSINYFLVPVLAKYKFKNNFYIELGLQFGLAYKSWVEYIEKNDDVDARIREYNKDQINRIDAGIRGGVGYKLLKGTGMNIGLAYYYGFVDVYKTRSGTNNQSFFLVLDIPIGKSKKPDTGN